MNTSYRFLKEIEPVNSASRGKVSIHTEFHGFISAGLPLPPTWGEGEVNVAVEGVVELLLRGGGGRPWKK